MDIRIEEYAKLINWKPKKLEPLSPPDNLKYPSIITIMHDFLSQKCVENKLLLPEIRKNGNESIGIYTDFGGEHKESKYYTYSILICGYNHSFGLNEEMKKLRQKFKQGNKEISFKDFAFGPIKRALEDYLNTIDFFVVGLLYNVVISKNIYSLFGLDKSNKNFITDLLNDRNLGEWKPKVAEKNLRIIHIVSYLINLLTRSDQKILWMTDNDAIAPNHKKHLETLEIFKNVLPLYTTNKYKMIGGALPFEENGISFLDFLSITDIAAGTLEQYFTERCKGLGKIEVKEGAEKVLQWLAHDGIGLKKQTIFLNLDDSGNILIGDVDIKDLQEDSNQKIYI